MKKTSIYILTSIMLIWSMVANSAPIQIKTNKPIGQDFLIALNAGLQVSVKWDNGQTDHFLSDSFPKNLIIKGTAAEISANADITSLFFGNNGITELTFDITANSIQRIYCPQNELTSLDLTFCQQLTELNVADNHLKKIKIESRLLENCDLSNNQLQELAIPNKGMYLKSLVLSGNHFKKLEQVDEMVSLQNIFCANNQLNTLSLQKNKKLRNVVVNSNQLKELNTQGLRHLEQIWISDNLVEKLDVASANSLMSLKADKNKLNTIKWNQNCRNSFKFIDIKDNNLFFNSFPTILNEKGNAIEAHIMPQNAYPIDSILFVKETYNKWVNEFTVNGWQETTNLQSTIKNEEGKTLTTPEDYTLSNGLLTFYKENNQVTISSQSDMYPKMTLSTTPFKVCNTLYGNVVFDFIYNGESIAKVSERHEYGKFITKIPQQYSNGFCTYDFDNITVKSAEDPIKVNVEWNGPFEISKNEQEATWYYLRINSSDKNIGYLHPIANKPISLSAISDGSPDFYWAFVGNPLNIKIINMAEAGKCLNASPAYPQLAEEDCYWQIFAANATKGKFLFYNSKYGYTSYNNGEIRYNVSHSQGAHLTIEKAPEFTTKYEEKVKEEIAPFFSSKHLDSYFSLKSEAYEKYKTEVNAAEIKCSYKTYQRLKQILSENIVYPEPGFYRLKNVGTGGYMHGISDTEKIYANNNEKSVETILEIRSELPPGTYYKEEKPFLLTQGRWCSYVSGEKSTPELLRNKANFVQYLPLAPGRTAFAIASYNGRPGYEQNLPIGYYTANEEGQVRGSSTTPTIKDEYAQWTIEKAENAEMNLLTIGTQNYGTLCAPFHVLLENAVAYVLTVEDGLGILEEVGKFVTAGTPVVIISKDSRVMINTENKEISSKKYKNNLKGVFLHENKNPNELSFGESENAPGFFKKEGRLREPNSAYLPYRRNYADGVKIGNINTGIKDLIIKKGTKIFDIQGRKIKNTKKGIYIINNHKVCVK